MGQRVQEEGASEGRAVMARIGVEPHGNITPRASGQTSLWSFGTREQGKPTQEAKQMTHRPSRPRHEGGDQLLVRPPAMRGLAPDRLVPGPPHRASAPGAYRAGNTGRAGGAR